MGQNNSPMPIVARYEDYIHRSIDWWQGMHPQDDREREAYWYGNKQNKKARESILWGDLLIIEKKSNHRETWAIAGDWTPQTDSRSLLGTSRYEPRSVKENRDVSRETGKAQSAGQYGTSLWALPTARSCQVIQSFIRVLILATTHFYTFPLLFIVKLSPLLQFNH